MEITGKKAVVFAEARGWAGPARSCSRRRAHRWRSPTSPTRRARTSPRSWAARSTRDVTDFAGVEHALNDAVAELGGLHITVTTAGGGMAQRTLGKQGPPSSTRSAGSWT
nr:hypothetical protein [Saccharopolyspora aridisoli]